MEPTPPHLNRVLISNDLDRLALILAPLVEARLPSGATAMMAMAGLAPVSSLIASSLAQVLALSDTELAALIDTAAIELGAMRGVRRPVGITYLAEHPEVAAAAQRLIEVIS